MLGQCALQVHPKIPNPRTHLSHHHDHRIKNSNVFSVDSYRVLYINDFTLLDVLFAI